MSGSEDSGELNPQALLDIGWSFASSRVLSAGVQLGVFTHIAAGHRTVEAIARASQASERGMRMLLDALAVIGLLTRSGDGYGLAPLAARFLVRASPDYLGALMETDDIWECWGGLVQAVRSGQPYRRVHQQEEAKKFFPLLIRTLHVLNRRPAERMAHLLGVGTSRSGLRVLDVGCGSAVWSIAVAQADGAARVTASDFPEVLEHTRTYLGSNKLEDRYDFLPGDLKQVDFGVQRYDLAILGNIVHSEGERSSRGLFKRLYQALAPLGRLAIIDMIPHDDRGGPAYAIFFALNMLVQTEAGGTFTIAEYTQWLSEAGFTRVETADIGIHSPLIIATRP
jgi:ubiquinone/menaquinone biosynthesis C-methylase UbiE